MAVTIQAIRVKHPGVVNTYLRRMLMVLGAAMIVLMMGWDVVVPIIQTNILINGLIITVFLSGLFICFQNLFRLKCDFIVLYDLDSLLFEHQYQDQQSASVYQNYKKKMFITTELFLSLQKSAEAHGHISKLHLPVARSLFSVASSRLDERRTRIGYFINLLIHLGLLGTFIGLSVTVGSIHGLTSNLAAGLSGEEDLTEMLVTLIGQLETPLSGMGTAFSTSLMGLSCSIMLGAIVVNLNKASMLFRNSYSNWLFEFALDTGEGVPREKNSAAELSQSAHCSPLYDSQVALEKIHDQMVLLKEVHSGQLAVLKQMEQSMANGQLRQEEFLEDIHQVIRLQDIGQRLDTGMAAMTKQGDVMAGLTANIVDELKRQHTTLGSQSDVMVELAGNFTTSIIDELAKQHQALKEQSMLHESGYALAASQREQLVTGQKVAQMCREQANNTLGSLNHLVSKIPENTAPAVTEAIEQSSRSLEVSLLRRIRFMVKRYHRFWLRLLRVEQQQVLDAISETMHTEQADHRQSVEKQMVGEVEKQRALLVRLFKTLHRIYRRLLRKR